MFCGKCGSKLPDGVSFCGKCGNKLGSKQMPEIVFSDPAPLERKGTSADHTSRKRENRKGSGIICLLMAALLIVQIVLFFVPFYQLSSGMTSDSGDYEYAATRSLYQIMTDGADGVFCYLTLALLIVALLLALLGVMKQKKQKGSAVYTIIVDGWMVFLLNQFSAISSRYTTTPAFQWSIIAALLTVVFGFAAFVGKGKR